MTAVRFPTEDGLTLEAEMRRADTPRGTAVICHPDPKFGGSKDHPLLWAIRNELAGRRGLTVLAFNFRGVMGSEGAHAHGEEEPSDVVAAVERVRREADGPTVAVGWSFGANVALRAALRDERIAALALVGTPLGEQAEVVPSLGEEPLERLAAPVLFVSGSRDAICPVDEQERIAARLPRAETRVVEGGNHAFSRRERDVATLIGDFFDRALEPGG